MNVNNKHIKQNIKVLCAKSKITINELLIILELPKNYITVLGLVRVSIYFNTSIETIMNKGLCQKR